MACVLWVGEIEIGCNCFQEGHSTSFYSYCGAWLDRWRNENECRLVKVREAWTQRKKDELHHHHFLNLEYSVTKDMRAVLWLNPKKRMAINFRTANISLNLPFLVWNEHPLINHVYAILECCFILSFTLFHDASRRHRLVDQLSSMTIILMNERDSKEKRRLWWSSLFKIW